MTACRNIVCLPEENEGDDLGEAKRTKWNKLDRLHQYPAISWQNRVLCALSRIEGRD
jgi:hypothetical protein